MDLVTFTLKGIRRHMPCGIKRGSGEGYDLLRKNLGKAYGDDTPITMTQIYESNGYDDALWCLRASDAKFYSLWRHFAVDCATQVEHLMQDKASSNALIVARKHAEGLATDKELSAARAAARVAALATALATAMAASRVAALDAARATAWDAARDAAMVAARATALATARVAARAGAWDVSMIAAWDAARDTARDDAWDAAWAAQMRLLQDYCRLGHRPENSVELLAKYINAATDKGEEANHE